MLADDVLQSKLNIASQMQTTLPLKFRFEDKIPEQEEKSDYEKEIDRLFCELNCVWALDEQQSFDNPEVGLAKALHPKPFAFNI